MSTKNYKSMTLRSFILSLVFVMVMGNARPLAMAMPDAPMQVPGEIDISFGTDGKVTTDFDNGTEFGFDIALQTDGRIVMAGYTHNGITSDFALARYNPDGSPDTTFNADGKVATNFGIIDAGRALAIQSDDKIILVVCWLSFATN